MPRNSSPSLPKTQGARANEGGQILEATIQPALEKKGFKFVTYKEWAKEVEAYPNGSFAVKGVPFTSIYEHIGRTEYLLISPERGIKTRIECKWQSVSGSVDEKLPYLYLNAIEAYPEDDIILVIDGNGWKPGAIQWLRTAVQQQKYTTQGFTKKIRVMNLMEFVTWVQRSL